MYPCTFVVLKFEELHILGPNLHSKIRTKRILEKLTLKS